MRCTAAISFIARENVDMGMHDRLSGGFVSVHADRQAGNVVHFFQNLTGDLVDDFKESAGIFGRHFRKSVGVFFRNHQRMAVGARRHVQKCQMLAIFINFVTGNFARGDFTEYTVHLSAPLILFFKERSLLKSYCFFIVLFKSIVLEIILIFAASRFKTRLRLS